MSNQKSDIYTLMQDMADALRTQDMIMLGGGSPAIIEEAVEIFQAALATVAADTDLFTHSVCQYSDSAGDVGFRELLADYINRKQGWKIGFENILITGGSQSAFKILFDHFISCKGKIVFPLLPDYIGYGIINAEDMLGVPGEIELIGNNQFRYKVAPSLEDNLAQAGALCISRPCNPSGGMLPDTELFNLLHLAQSKKLPVILDNAYGQPLPNIVYSKRSLPWADNAIYCLSLSKLGLPGVRTGMVIADKVMIQTLTRLNAKQALAPGGIGPAMASVLIQSGDLEKLSDKVLQPWYAARSQKVVNLMDRYFSGLPIRYHEVDGGFFNWIYCEDLPISGHALYELLKEEKVLVVPGYAFSPGLKQDWAHLQKCFRISTGQPLDKVEEGIAKIAQVLAQVLG